MNNRNLTLSILFGCLFGGVVCELSQSWCERTLIAGFNGEAYKCVGVPPFLLSYMWSPVQVNIVCPNARYSVYKGDSEDLLLHNVKEKSSAFCGLTSLLDGRTCRLTNSPFWNTYVGIKDTKGCVLDSKVEFSWYMLIAGLAGAALFYSAPWLTSSIFFRLSCGSILFTTGSLAILAFIIIRNVPHKRTATMILGIMGSSSFAALKWLTGHWLPSWAQLSQNPIFQAYVVFSATCGAALTFWLDDHRNPKLNTLISMSLRVVSLGMLYYSTWMMPVAFAGVSGVLLTSLISPEVQENMHKTTERVKRVTKATKEIIMSPFRKSTISTPVARTEDMGSPAFSFWGSASAARRKQEQLLEQRTLRALLGLPPVDEPDINRLVPMHLKTPPPDPWAIAESVKAQSFEEKYTEALLKEARGARAPKSGGNSGGRRRGGGAPDAPAASATYVATTGAPSQILNPRVALGYIFNPVTGRTIKIGGDTYMRLIEAGWQPDLQAGAMVPSQDREVVDGTHTTESPTVTGAGRRSLRSSGGMS